MSARTKLLRIALSIATASLAAPALAAPAVCAPPASGLPALSGPPNWVAATTSSPRDRHWDDPRWLGAAGLSYGRGAATPPVTFRALSGLEPDCTPTATDTCRRVYLQWRIKTAIFLQPHVLMVMLRRPGPTPAGLLLQLNLNQLVGADAGDYGAPTEFATPPQCVPGTPACVDATSDAFAAFTEIDALVPGPEAALPDDCRAGQPAYARWQQFDASATPGAYGWLNTLQYERTCTAGAAPSTVTGCDYWTVSLRLPELASGADFSAGVVDGDLFAYELWAPTSSGLPICTAANPCARIDSWPRTAPTSADELCRDRTQLDPAVWLHASFVDDTAWSRLRTSSAATATDCLRGVAITSDDIGVIVRAETDPSPPTSTSATLGWQLKAQVGAAAAINRVVARPRNNGAAAVAATFRARFRLAQWGSQAFDGATWSDIPDSDKPNLNYTEDPSAAVRQEATAPVTVAPGGRAVVSYEWKLDAVSQCQYGLASTCTSCTCDDGSAGPCVTTTIAASQPCRRRLWEHQCLMVELSSDDDVDFERTSAYRNLQLSTMSETAAEAWVSTRGLPTLPGQKLEEIYLVVMPRNTPRVVPAGSTGLDLIRAEAARERARLLRPYLERAQRLSEAELVRLGEETARRGQDGEIVLDGPRAIRGEVPAADLPRAVLGLMPRGARAAAEFYDGLARYQGGERDDGFGGVTYGAHAATALVLDAMTDEASAQLVPTLDIYPFRHIPGQTTMDAMTSFALIAHHHGPLTGITWELDGAERLGPNLFRVVMPVGHRHKLRVRMRSGDDKAQVPGDRNYPCAGGCCHRGYCSEPDLAAGNGLPLLAVGALWTGLGRRRRRRGRADATAARPAR
jgi:hypothetical protein